MQCEQQVMPKQTEAQSGVGIPPSADTLQCSSVLQA